jgi:shikimate kinase/3-dehydroquinate synthase
MQRWVFLSGLMGTGKSTVGRALAEALGVSFLDLDAIVAHRAGMSIPELFATRGEEAFRALEAEEAQRLIAEHAPAVLALGGGTVVRQATRRALLRAGVLITLRASARELARRLEGTTDRPLLARGEAAHILEGLLVERDAAYAECHASVDTEGRSVPAIVEAIRAVTKAAPVVVPLGARTYRVDVGTGLLGSLVDRLGPRSSVLVVTDANVHERWARPLATALGTPVEVVLAPGEEHKTLESVARIWDAALAAGVDREALVLAVGGGVVGDLAGFAASTLLRGIDFVQVPTSLLAMVDASVGGKTGFDRAQGKNLIGTFHQPRHVTCDVDTLTTLPDEELRSGLAEVVKAAWIDSESAVRALEADAAALVARDPGALQRAVRMGVQLKADVVSEDERESGRRMVLNLGHTLGHAIEAARGFVGIRHGEAVALGMVVAFHVAASLGVADAAEHGARMRSLLERLGLPTDVRPWLDERTLERIGADKKRSGRSVRYVVPSAPGVVELAPIEVDALRSLCRGLR